MWCPICELYCNDDSREDCPSCGTYYADVADMIDERDDYENDGQPDEYTEWQDYMGGDDWDHGQYDDCGGDW